MQLTSMFRIYLPLRLTGFIFTATTGSVFALGFDLVGSIRFAAIQSVLFFVTTSRDSRFCSVGMVNNAVIKHVLAMLFVTLCWISFVSTDNVFFRFVFLCLLIFTLFGLRRLSFDQLEDPEVDYFFTPSLHLLKIFILVVAVLIVRSWTNLLFVLMPLAVCFKFLSLRKTNQRLKKQFPINIGILLLFILGSWLSHLLVERSSSQFWVSYDQVFRSAIATSVTRWGWTDSSFGFGHSLTYHWLPEGLGGVLSRFSGFSETDVTSRLLPALGILFSAVAILKLQTYLQINSKVIWLTAFTILVLASSFETYSIGTLWGGGLSILLTSLFLESIMGSKEFPSIITYSVVPFFLLLSQSALGLASVSGVVISLILFVFLRRICLRIALGNFIVVCLTLFFVQRVFFQTSPLLSNSFPLGFTNFLNFPMLQIPHGISAGSSDLAVKANSFFYLLFLFASVSLSFVLPSTTSRIRVWRIFLVSQFVEAVLLANFFSLGGGYAAKFLVPIQLLGLIGSVIAISQFVLLVPKRHLLFLFISSMIALILATFFVSQIQDFGRLNQSLFTFISILLSFLVCLTTIIVWHYWSNRQSLHLLRSFSYLLLVFSFSTFCWFSRDVISVTKERLSSPAIDASFFLGGVETRLCLDFVRLNTPTNSVIATTIWKLPTSVLDERYVLTSLLTHRRSLVDGPVFAHVNWSSIDEFENLKNIHTSFLNNLDMTSRRTLRSLGASYFVMDTRFENDDRTWTDLDDQEVVYSNSECSILKL